MVIRADLWFFTSDAAAPAVRQYGMDVPVLTRLGCSMYS